MGETREHLLLYPFSDQKPNICCHRCSISNQLKNTPFHKKLMTMFVNVETNSYFPINYFDDFLFYWFLCFMDSPSKIFIFKFIRVAVGKKLGIDFSRFLSKCTLWFSWPLNCQGNENTEGKTWNA